MSGSDSKKRKRRGERKDGRILVTLVVGVTETGKPKRKFFYGRTRQEAEAKRDHFVQLRRAGISGSMDALTVDAWVKEWCRKYKNDEYVRANKTYIDRLSEAIGFRLIRGVVESDLYAALASVSGMSFSTVNKYRAFIRQVFSAAVRNRIIEYDPSIGLELPSYEKGSHRALERWEIETIMQNWNQHRAGIWAMLMLLCGLRRGEMAALRWENVDMESRTIKVCQTMSYGGNKPQLNDRTKTPAGMRTIPICDPLYDALNSIPQEQRSGFVCVSANGEQLTVAALSRGWKGFNLAMQRILNHEDVVQKGRRETLEKKIEMANQAGKTYIQFSIRMHDLRHTFATALYDAGVSTKGAQYYLGHTDINMTLDLYTHLSDERRNADNNKMIGFFNELSARENELNSEPM